MSNPTVDTRFSSDAHAPDAHAHPKPRYYAIFFTLVALTVVTVLAAFLGITAEWAKVAIALAIASVKAWFVAMFFMHLKYEGKLIYMVVIAPLVLTVILVCALIPDVVMPGLSDAMLGRPIVK